MLARRSGAGTGIRARHVPDTSRIGGIDGSGAYAGLKRLVMITEVGNLEGPGHGDVDLWHREITVQGKGRRIRVIKIGFGAARSLDRYLRVRARHAQAWRWQLWPGPGNRGPMTASGIYQVTVRRGRQCGIEVFPHRFRHHFSHTWLDHGGAEGDLMELNGWTSSQMLRR